MMQRMTGMTLLFVCLLVIAIQTSSAFFFNIRTRKQQAARKPVDEECVALARQGDCSFYRCFDERHPCTNSSSNYAIKYGWRFCSRFDLHYDQLTAQGKLWLNGTKLCTMEGMLDLYRSDAVSCVQIDDQMKERQAACEAENGLCQHRLLVENKDIFSDVYALNRRSAEHFLRSVRECTLAKFRDAATWFREQLHSFEEIGQSVLPFFQDVEQNVQQLKENIQDEFNKLSETIQQLGTEFRAINTEKTPDDVEVD